jgi:hypothetical protein
VPGARHIGIHAAHRVAGAGSNRTRHRSRIKAGTAGPADRGVGGDSYMQRRRRFRDARPGDSGNWPPCHVRVRFVGKATRPRLRSFGGLARSSTTPTPRPSLSSPATTALGRPVARVPRATSSKTYSARCGSRGRRPRSLRPAACTRCAASPRFGGRGGAAGARCLRCSPTAPPERYRRGGHRCALPRGTNLASQALPDRRRYGQSVPRGVVCWPPSV